MTNGSTEERSQSQNDVWPRIERELRTPISPPVGFAERVLATVSAVQEPGAEPRTRAARSWWLAAAGIAAALLVAFLVLSPRNQPPVSALETGPQQQQVTFELAVPHAESVVLLGDFNRWDPAAARMEDADGDGVWSITLQLRPGRYQYGFLVNGLEWVPDPQARRFAQDGFGGRNAILRI